MPFEYGGQCFATIAEAGAAYCKGDFPKLETPAATTTQVVSCTSAIQSPLNASMARVTVARSNGGTGAPTTIAYEVAFPSCVIEQSFNWQSQSHLMQASLIAGAVLALFLGFRSGDRVV